MKRIPVVTVFVEHRLRLLVLKRSAGVRSYPGLWHGVSGTIEGSPLDQARRELRQELGLRAEQVPILRQGAAFEVDDDEADVHVLVHPVLAHLSDPAAIQLNWENDELRWIEPTELRSLASVPQLEEAYRRVDPLTSETDDERFATEMQAIAGDLISGSAELATQALETMRRAAIDWFARDPERALARLEALAAQAVELRPSMAAVGNLTLRLIDELRRAAAEGADPLELRETCFRFSQRLVERQESAIERIAELLGKRLADRRNVLIHSYSSTVVRAMARAKPELERVVVTESRPGMEGRRTAQALARAGFDVELIVDAAAAHWMERVDAIVVGCDSILDDGSVINKIGTRMLALLAANQGTPVFVVADSLKFQLSVPADEVPLEEKDPDEVYMGPPAGVSPRNLYFDRTPARWITRYITERGDVTADELYRSMETSSS
ncbi:MAG: NUDIX domain-containing protein [Myxococcales bacterium]|nr:NUDIX domain-containing protein [Myxococcales bacterium]